MKTQFNKQFLSVLFASFVMIASHPARAFQEGQWNLNGGFGINGSRGLFGISNDYFFSEHHALSTAIGLDIVGATATVGYKYFTSPSPAIAGVWGKCFFFFDCDHSWYGGVSLQYANATKMEVWENDVMIRQYDVSDKLLGLVSLGVRSVLTNHVTFDTEITYKNILSGGEVTQTLGTREESDDRVLNWGQHDLGLGIAIGYLF